jgi:hypothetical protein
MKKLAFVVYIVSVLLISGLARANTLDSFVQAQYTSPTLLHKVVADGLDVYTTYTLPSPCSEKPSVRLTQEDEFTLTLRLSSPSPKIGEMCALPVETYTSRIQLPLLVRASKVTVDPTVEYLIKVEGYAFSMRVLGADLLSL